MRNQDKLLQSERASAAARPSVLADPALSDRERCLPGNRSFGIHAAPRQGESPNPRSVLIDQAYDEYCEGYEAGQDQDVDAFCARFPRFKTSLRKLIVAHDLLEAHEEYMEDGKSIPRLAEDLCLGLQDDDKTPWPAPGQTFLGFELLEELGRGAFARVFLATEPALGNREVAVKISRGGSAEAKTLGRLNHPNIVPVHSVREDRSTGLTLVCMPYLGCATLGDVFDYVFEKGSPPAAARIIGDAVEDVALLHQPPLDLRMVRGPWNRGHYVDAVVEIAIQLADALVFIHGLGVCHRDLKPSNVLMSSAGRAMLLDFNLSFDRRLEAQRLGGTLPYMSPEQLLSVGTKRDQAQALVGGSSDLFSLGVILYELLSGQNPFGPDSPKLPTAEVLAILLERRRRGPESLCRSNAHVDKSLAQIVESCLAYNPNDRPKSAAELAARLRKHQSRLPRLRRWAGRNARKLACVAALVLVVAGAGAYGISQREPAGLRWLRQGQESYKAGDYQKSIEAITRAFEAEPGLQDRPDAYYTRGRAHQRLGRLAAAELAACADQEQMALLESESHQQFTAAWQDFQPALRRCQGQDFAELSGKLHVCRAYCYNQVGQHESATPDYEEALRAGLETPEILNNLGYSYWKAGRLKEAKQNLDRSVQLNGDLQAPYHNRAAIALAEALQERTRISSGLSAPDLIKMLLQPALHLERGTADMAKAIALGPQTVRLHREAACLYTLSGTHRSHQIDLLLKRLERWVALSSRPPSKNPRSLFSLLYKVARERIVAAALDDAAVERAFYHLDQALDLGQDAAILRSDVCLRHLPNHGRFQTLIGKQRIPVRPCNIETHFIDPIRDSAD